jgi:hypothetical protein
LNSISQDYVPRVGISKLNVIYSVLHPSLLLCISDKLSRNAFLILIQEVKRDIICRWMNPPPISNTSGQLMETDGVCCINSAQTSILFPILWRASNRTAFIHSLTGPIVNPLLPVIRDLGSIPGGYLCETGILLLVLYRYIGDSYVINHCGLN